MKKIVFLAFVIPLSWTCLTWAASILDIPQGAIFELQEELEIPPNRDFAVLGENQIDETFNAAGQILNNQDGRYIGNVWPGTPGKHHFLTFNSYYTHVFESYEETYVKCLERHRRYFGMNRGGRNTVIVQNGRDNIAVINPGNHSSDDVYSDIGENYCTAPNHTIAALVIDQDEAGSGGFFAEGYKFKVKKVEERQRGFYNVTKIYFDHKVLAGIVIVSTHKAEEIPMSSLEASESSTDKGFWISVGQALNDLTHIGGHYFQIKQPEKHYYE